MKRRSFREMAVRVVLLLIGLWIAHLGVTLFLQTNLGSDPFNVFVQGLFRAIPWPAWAGMTHGRVHLLVSLLIMVVLLVVDRSYVGIGTVLCMALGGPIIDVYTLWLSPFLNETLPLAVRVPMLAVGCVILAFGMTIVIRSQAGTGPNDLVAVVLSDKSGKPFGPVRIGVDLTFALVGFALGGVVGIGTIICAFLVGPAAQLFFPVSEKICVCVLNQFAGVNSRS
ncbi:YitT family protein [Pseudoflavonifractor sp. P01025]|uniref:YczE/YyaS/YitT family protein n=1 Tax=Flintibacter porci TaxID=3342383 RepID=UPI0035B5906C